MCTDTVQSSGGLMLSGVPRESAWQTHSVRVHPASVMACCNTNVEGYFHFLPFPVKVKIHFGVLSVSKDRY